MVETILDLEDTLNDLISAFESENKLAVTGITLDRENRSEDNIGDPVIKLHLVVPYTTEH